MDGLAMFSCFLLSTALTVECFLRLDRRVRELEKKPEYEEWDE